MLIFNKFKIRKNTINILRFYYHLNFSYAIMAGLDKPTNGEIWFNEKMLLV